MINDISGEQPNKASMADVDASTERKHEVELRLKEARAALSSGDVGRATHAGSDSGIEHDQIFRRISPDVSEPKP